MTIITDDDSASRTRSAKRTCLGHRGTLLSFIFAATSTTIVTPAVNATQAKLPPKCHAGASVETLCCDFVRYSGGKLNHNVPIIFPASETESVDDQSRWSPEQLVKLHGSKRAVVAHPAFFVASQGTAYQTQTLDDYITSAPYQARTVLWTVPLQQLMGDIYSHEVDLNVSALGRRRKTQVLSLTLACSPSTLRNSAAIFPHQESWHGCLLAADTFFLWVPPAVV